MPGGGGALDGAQLSVEVLGPGLRVVRVTGVLVSTTAARLLRVVLAQLERPGTRGHLVVDLGGVGGFGCADLAELAEARDACLGAGVHLHLTGLAAREPLLPTGVICALARFSTFATVEQAERALAGRVPIRRPLAGPRSRLGWPCPSGGRLGV